MGHTVTMGFWAPTFSEKAILPDLRSSQMRKHGTKKCRHTRHSSIIEVCLKIILCTTKNHGFINDYHRVIMFIIILTWCNHHVPMAYHHVPMVCQNLSTVYYHVLCEFNVVSHFETDPAIVPALNCV